MWRAGANTVQLDGSAAAGADVWPVRRHGGESVWRYDDAETSAAYRALEAADTERSGTELNFPTKAEATKAARRARALLNNPKGWSVCVNSSCRGSWYFKLSNGPMHLWQYESGFSCLLADDMGSAHGGGSYLWHDTYHHHNPNKVIEHKLKLARRVAARINAVVAHVEGLL